MTTAHRPTYNPTKGSSNLLANPSLQHSSRDLPANMNIKYREEGQGAINEIKEKEFKSELLKREKEYKQSEDNVYNSKTKVSFTNQIEKPELLYQEDQEQEEELVFPQDKDVSYIDEDEDDLNNNNKKQHYDSDSIDSEEELLIELEKIKQHQKKEKERKDMEIKEKTQKEILKRNPLLNQSNEDYSDNTFSNNDYSLKRKWYEDSVFKNQSKLDQKVQKRFINDTVRSDFHRKFLSKTIQ